MLLAHKSFQCFRFYIPQTKKLQWPIFDQNVGLLFTFESICSIHQYLYIVKLFPNVKNPYSSSLTTYLSDSINYFDYTNVSALLSNFYEIKNN